MITVHRAVAPLRIFLVLLFALLLMFQTFSLPGQFRYLAQQSPESAYLRWPLTAVFVFWVLCVQVVIVCTWKLLTLVQQQRIFSSASLVWVDAIVGAIVAGWLVLVGVSVYFGLRADDPGLPLMLFLFLLVLAVLALLMLVLRALLRQATTLRTDMDAVI